MRLQHYGNCGMTTCISKWLFDTYDISHAALSKIFTKRTVFFLVFSSVVLTCHLLHNPCVLNSRVIIPVARKFGTNNDILNKLIKTTFLNIFFSFKRITSKVANESRLMTNVLTLTWCCKSLKLSNSNKLFKSECNWLYFVISSMYKLICETFFSFAVSHWLMICCC